ncbi:hypothetical protein KC717_03735 [Candidatus Dojkabacteria bacterium]|uniref:Uncharacterized protein n=1 Tax=Candidatus Dojkabacteria bacterium TaxID=2099670 RepID=A0A955L817_9BACT|nr:hypothetical protein [Candidatus Dojkabacteria bacterium]
MREQLRKLKEYLKIPGTAHLSRRQFLLRATATLGSVVVANTLLAACGGENDPQPRNFHAEDADIDNVDATVVLSSPDVDISERKVTITQLGFTGTFDGLMDPNRNGERIDFASYAERQEANGNYWVVADGPKEPLDKRIPMINSVYGLISHYGIENIASINGFSAGCEEIAHALRMGLELGQFSTDQVPPITFHSPSSIVGIRAMGGDPNEYKESNEIPPSLVSFEDDIRELLTTYV